MKVILLVPSPQDKLGKIIKCIRGKKIQLEEFNIFPILIASIFTQTDYTLHEDRNAQIKDIYVAHNLYLIIFKILGITIIKY